MDSLSLYCRCVLFGGLRRIKYSVMWRVPGLVRRLPDNLSTQWLTMAVGHNRHGVRSTVRGGVPKPHCKGPGLSNRSPSPVTAGSPPEYPRAAPNGRVTRQSPTQTQLENGTRYRSPMYSVP